MLLHGQLPPHSAIFHFRIPCTNPAKAVEHTVQQFVYLSPDKK